MPAFAITSRMRAKRGQEDAFAVLLVEYEKACAHHAGLLYHSIQRNVNDAREFIFYELYDSEEHLRLHRAAPENRAWAPVRDAHIEERHVDTWQLMNLEGPAAQLWKSSVCAEKETASS